MTEGRLRNRVAAYEHELAWAPRYVANELEAAHTALRRHQTDATVWTARADAETDPLEADQLRAAAAAAREHAEQLAAQVEQLELADHARSAWWTATAVTRDNSERARVALNLRGIDLDAPDDRVTTQEWLEAEEAARVAEDAEREIRDEHDLAEPSHDTERVELAGVLEPAPLDIRHIATADASEHRDPDQRRRVPLPDETAATVDRAQAALAEIGQRTLAEAAEATRAAQQEPDEDARRAELTRWADESADDTARTNVTDGQLVRDA